MITLLSGVDTEKILEAGFTGLDARAGDLMISKDQASKWVSLLQHAYLGYINVHYATH
jgi:hypothetical protein